MYASKTPRDLNHDPKPYTDIETPLRYIYAPSGTDYYFRYDPRPEFDHVQHNEPNPILVKIREIPDADRGNWISGFLSAAERVRFAAWNDAEVDHARNVLSRLARLVPAMTVWEEGK